MLSERLQFAREIIRDAHRFILSHYQTGAAIERKTDDSPVTIADRGAEQLLRERIASTFPDDGIIGEEHPEKPGTTDYCWILDPIDGTKAFIHGVPLFGCLIGIRKRDELISGVCGFPALDEVIYADAGKGAWREQRDTEPMRCRVTETARLADAMMGYTEISGYNKRGRRDALDRIVAATRLARGWGDCYGHMLVATGRADLMVDPEMNPWDAGALLPILREAGGHYFGWNGEPSAFAGDGISTNGLLKDAVLEVLGRTGRRRIE